MESLDDLASAGSNHNGTCVGLGAVNECLCIGIHSESLFLICGLLFTNSPLSTMVFPITTLIVECPGLNRPYHGGFCCSCIFNIGFPSMDAFLCVVLLNMLQGEFVGLCDQVTMAMSAATSISPYMSNDILKRLELEQQLLDGTVRTADTALLATQKGHHPQSTKLCSNCNHTGHLIATCWCEGGGMAGQWDEIVTSLRQRRHNTRLNGERTRWACHQGELELRRGSQLKLSENRLACCLHPIYYKCPYILLYMK